MGQEGIFSAKQLHQFLVFVLEILRQDFMAFPGHIIILILTIFLPVVQLKLYHFHQATTELNQGNT